jgi:hypothetical protein
MSFMGRQRPACPAIVSGSDGARRQQRDRTNEEKLLKCANGRMILFGA